MTGLTNSRMLSKSRSAHAEPNSREKWMMISDRYTPLKVLVNHQQIHMIGILIGSDTLNNKLMEGPFG